jgi:aerobic carbon-monoxide dehydrogenase large subunit
VTTLKSAINRVTAATMEPRCCIGDYDTRDERYTLYTGTQRPHSTRYDN